MAQTQTAGAVGVVTPEQYAAMQAQLAELQAKLASKQKITFKVSKEKRALSVYGLNVMFPVTLYAGQWRRLIAAIPQLEQFMKDHAAELAERE